MPTLIISVLPVGTNGKMQIQKDTIEFKLWNTRNMMESYPIESAEEAQEFMDWVDEEGGLMGFLLRSGEEGYPLEIQEQAKALDIAYAHFYRAYHDYFETKWAIR